MSAQTSRPNILFLLTDDQRWDTIGAAGNPHIRTPHLDHLCRGGVRFANNFTTTAICMSSRASIFTGLYLRAHGINDFNSALRPADLDRSYFNLLREHGYRTGFIGKFGVGDAHPLPGDRFDWFRGFPRQGNYFPEDPKGRTGPHLTPIMGDQAIEFLGTCDAKRPFCLSISFKAPHAQDADPDQFLHEPELSSLYADAEIPRARTTAQESFDTLPDFMKSPSEGRVRWEKRFRSPQLANEMTRRYYRLISGVDTVIGRIRAELSRRGFADNTIIVFTSDNGMLLGEHGLTDKWFMFEESIRIPLVVYDPRLPARLRGQVRQEMTLNVDIAPSLFEFAGISPPVGTQGRSFVPLVRGGRTAWRQDWYYEHRFQHKGIPTSEGVRTENWKYIRYPGRNHEELFDLAKDPLEETNLAPVQSDQLERLRKRCADWSRALDTWDRHTAWREPAVM
jgi:arylsulfatase A-like enzyme